MRDPLTQLAILYGTDKFGYHDYTPNYFKLLKHLREKPVKVLEIGVGGYADNDRGGQSLRVWRDFFEQGEITGIDIQKKTMDLGPRVQILQGSQIDPEFLQELVEKRGPFDVIIDDGSHRNEHIVESYRLLFPTLAPGGVYVAEDVQTSFHPRFGGSLTLEAPNSIGYFSDLMARMNNGDDDPLIRDIAAIERYHNMIALYKRPEDASARDVFATDRFADLGERDIAVTIIGDQDFAASRLPVRIGQIRHASWDEAEAAKGADLVICRLTEGHGQADAGRINDLLTGLNEGGILVVHSDRPEQHFSAGDPLMDQARHRFKMIDHVEIIVHHPQAEIDALAAQIYSMERYPNALLFYKSPNAYPSNFAYDATNPQAKAAIARMGEVLEGATNEGGLIQYAGLLTRHISRPAARDVIMRLAELNANSREFYQMAGALAQVEGRMDDAERLFRAALEKFPLDPHFSVALANVALNQANIPRAEEILREAYAENPRSSAVIAQLSRVCSINGKLDEAITLGRKSITLFPRHARPRRLAILAQLQVRAGRMDDAQATLDEAAKLAAATS